MLTFDVGDTCHLFGRYAPHGDTIEGKVIAKVDLPGWLNNPHYIVEVEIGAPDPMLEVRCGLNLCRFPVRD